MSETLLIITSTYPYGSGEAFLETELEELVTQFPRIILFPIRATDEDKKVIRKTDEKVEVFSLNGNPLSLYQNIVGSLRCLANRRFWMEVREMFRRKRFRVGYALELLKFTVFAEDKVKQKERINLEIKDDERVILYSYWFHIPAYFLATVKWGFCPVLKVSRGHGFDIYEYRFKEYIPYRKYFFDNIDCLYCIAKDGQAYLQEKYPEYRDKISLSRLGTKDNGVSAWKRENCFHIVSCSRMVRLKRIDRIIDSLSQIKDISIKWTHFGEGPLLDSTKEYAAEKLSNSNVVYEFMGVKKNSEVLEYYSRENIDCFLNVSETEGVPVSIMEAMSYGIPIIATAVGGTPEIVSNDINGYLLNKDFSDEDLTRCISRMACLEEKQYTELRKSSRRLWENISRGEKNYREFALSLKQKMYVGSEDID